MPLLGKKIYAEQPARKGGRLDTATIRWLCICFFHVFYHVRGDVAVYFPDQYWRGRRYCRYLAARLGVGIYGGFSHGNGGVTVGSPPGGDLC